MGRSNKTSSFLAATLSEITTSNSDVKDSIIADLKSQIADASQINILEVDLDFIDPSPYQCRTYFDDQEMEQLTASIKEFGVITPLIVRMVSERYELIAGHRRHASLKLVGKVAAPVRILSDVSDEQAAKLVLIENLKRADISPIEEVRSVLALVLRMNLPSYDSTDKIVSDLKKIRLAASGKTKKSFTSEQERLQNIAKELVETTTKNKWDSFLVHRLTLIDLPIFLQEKVIRGFEYTKAKLLWKITKVLGQEEGEKIAQQAFDEKLSLSEIRKYLPVKNPEIEAGEVKTAPSSYSNTYELISGQLKDIDSYWGPDANLSVEEIKSLKSLIDPLSAKIDSLMHNVVHLVDNE
jgi:ParB/RepB/Spo0J family partition protein